MLFRKPKTFQDSDFGKLTHCPKPQSHWVSEAIPTSEGGILIDLPGDSAGPSRAALSIAKQTLSQLAPLLTAAISHVQQNSEAQEFIEGQGSLTLDGLSFTETSGTFNVELALSDWPDAMISVVFRGGSPCDVLLAD